jgi:hypothetical protein
MEALAPISLREGLSTETSQLKDHRDKDKRGSVLGCKKNARSGGIAVPFSTEGRRTHE